MVAKTFLDSVSRQADVNFKTFELLCKLRILFSSRFARGIDEDIYQEFCRPFRAIPVECFAVSTIL